MIGVLLVTWIISALFHLPFWTVFWITLIVIILFGSGGEERDGDQD